MRNIRLQNILFSFLVTGLCLIGSASSYAQVDSSMYSFGAGPGEYIKVVPRNDNPDGVASYKQSTPDQQAEYIYEEITMESLSHLYWAVNFLDIENDKHVDNFMKINECEIYTNYKGSEFEWKEVREAGREFIRKNKEQFPLRFRIVQPLMLRDYDMKRKAFLIDPEYQIMAVRRFEAFPMNVRRPVCDDLTFREIEGYSRGIVLELSRPFSLTYVPAKPDLAMSYIEEKDNEFRRLRDKAQTDRNRYRLRTAYIVFKIKVFAHRKLMDSPTAKIKVTQMMAAMEGFEIYTDKDLKKPFYEKNYIEVADSAQVSEALAKEYEILKEKHKGIGVLY